MSYRFIVNGIPDIRFQGLNLNCGRYCMEAMLRWKHGTQYGAVPDDRPKISQIGKNAYWEVGYGNARQAHSTAVQKHINTRLKTGFKLDGHAEDYGLVKMRRVGTADEWVKYLRDYGPITVSGHIGTVRMFPFGFGGHYVLVIGVTTKNEIAYLDPLRPRSARHSKSSVLSEAKFAQLTKGNNMFVMARDSKRPVSGGHRG